MSVEINGLGSIKLVDVNRKEDGTIDVNEIPVTTPEDTTGEEQENSVEEDGVVDDSVVNDTPVGENVEDDDTLEEEPINDDSDDSDDEQEPEDDQANYVPSDDEVADWDELPESIQRYLEFYEETGGSLQDFFQVNQDVSNLPDDQLIYREIQRQYPEFSDEEIREEMQDRFGIDELDSEKDIKIKSREKKKFLGEVKNRLKEQSERFKADLGSRREAELPQDVQEALELTQRLRQQDEVAKTVRNDFISKTNKLFGKNFEGFKVKLGDSEYKYKPENVNKVKDFNSDINNFYGKFTDEKGNVTDVEGYHKALTIASNPEAFAQHFFELGKAASIEEEARDSKNIKKGTVQLPQKPPQPKVTLKVLNDDKRTSGGINLKAY